MAFLDPVTLRGDVVTLEPLTTEHVDGLAAAVGDGELWRLWVTRVPRPEDVAAAVGAQLALQRAGTSLPLVTRLVASGRVVGMTTFLHADAANRRVEIGSTWLARSAQRTGANVEAKYLMLRHAFDEWGCHGVELRTHRMNRRSRAAIEALGAQQDGVLRHHTVMPDGTLRDTVVYSVVAPEWPAVRAHLRHRLAEGGAAAS